jgi:hypothetical protein
MKRVERIQNYSQISDLDNWVHLLLVFLGEGIRVGKINFDTLSLRAASWKYPPDS